ncbi:MAG TPA: NAD(P)-dependent alcohol dehydrogenase [Ignavibacteria bacterium]
MKIKSYASYKKGEELKLYEFEAEEPGRYGVEIKISHCGICHSDIHMIDNDWMMSGYPLVPGHEIIGVVTKIGEDVKGLTIGQRVGVGWQSESCHVCEWCSSGMENLCSENKGTIVGRHGGFADFIITDSRFAFPIPEKMDSETTAPLLCGGITVYSPLRFFGAKPKDKIGVIGIGGLGHLAIQFAKAMGCEVTAFSSSPDKEAEAKSFGAENFISSKDGNALKKAAGKLDFIISTVTANLDWVPFVTALKPTGRLNFVGASVGNLDIPVGMLLQYKSVSGSMIGGRAMIAEMLEFASRNHVKAKTELFAFADVNKAIKKVRDNTIRYRAVLKI